MDILLKYDIKNIMINNGILILDPGQKQWVFSMFDNITCSITMAFNRGDVYKYNIIQNCT